MQKYTKCPVTIHPSVYICFAVLLLLIPIRWLFAWGLAAVFHELCHYCVITLLRGQVSGVRISMGGAVMETNELGKTEELLSSLAGPAGGFLLLLFARWFPRLAICGWCQAVYNLIPIYPLDGGRALRCLLGRFMREEQARNVSVIIENLVLFGFLFVSIYLWFFGGLGPIPMVFVILTAIKTGKIKFPCNEAQQRVQ